MLLGELHTLLRDIYALEMSYDIYDFLITDARLASALDVNGRNVDEKLLIAEDTDATHVSLYIAEELLARLGRNNPLDRLDACNLEDFWTLLEGISHFTYYAWNAAREKSVTLMEMELQAEVDKFIGTTLLLQRQGRRPPRRLHHWLFDLPRFDERLTAGELTRYHEANRYAGKYCRKLANALPQRRLSGEVMRELRRFYRLTQPAKIEHIEAPA